MAIVMSAKRLPIVNEQSAIVRKKSPVLRLRKDTEGFEKLMTEALSVENDNFNTIFKK